MVTGIEVTGIALAIFPLVIEGLKSYSNGARTIKDMWRPQMALKSLIRELGMEQCKFENTLTSLLEGIVSESDQLSLMNDPGGELWYTEDLQNTLESRLRTTKAVQVYVDSMNDLVFVLKTLEDKFVLGSEVCPLHCITISFILFINCLYADIKCDSVNPMTKGL
jgi:hypothetical protein